MSAIEETLAFHIAASDLPLPVREYVFAPPRKWRFDFAWPERKLAAECEGATWSGGRHTRGSGFEKDAEKYNAAALAGWRVVRFTSGMVKDGRAIRTLEGALS